jgi:hypothetical protein
MALYPDGGVDGSFSGGAGGRPVEEERMQPPLAVWSVAADNDEKSARLVHIVCESRTL